MTERAFLTDPREAQGLHVGSITRLIRMVDRQPDVARPKSGCSAYFAFWDGMWRWMMQRTDGKFYPQRGLSLHCPLGVAGDQLWLAEVWGVASRPCPNLGWYDGIEYANEQAALEEHDILPCHHVEIPDDVDLDELKGQWNSAASMPRWASSLILDVTDVRILPLDHVTEEDYFATGRKMPPIDDGSMIALNYWWIAELKKIFPAPEGGCWPRWNPYLWLATVAKTEEVSA